MNKCHFCGEMKETASTTFVGQYCIDCHEVVIEQSEEVIKEIKSNEDNQT